MKHRYYIALCTLFLFFVYGLVSAEITPQTLIIVDSNGDGGDTTPGNGVCKTAANTCTLRAAIQEANATATIDQIAFNSNMTIVLTAGALPLISADDLAITALGGVNINGNDQANIFTIGGGRNTIAGLNLYNTATNTGALIHVNATAQDSQIFGNRLGTATDGATCSSCNGGYIGVSIGGAGAVRTYIYNNLIRCHAFAGINLQSNSAFIGLTPASAAAGNVIQDNQDAISANTISSVTIRQR